jgi:hypothetical protein
MLHPATRFLETSAYLRETQNCDPIIFLTKFSPWLRLSLLTHRAFHRPHTALDRVRKNALPGDAVFPRQRFSAKSGFISLPGLRQDALRGCWGVSERGPERPEEIRRANSRPA